VAGSASWSARCHTVGGDGAAGRNGAVISRRSVQRQERDDEAGKETA
jgi:hypothetical protein